MCGLGVLGMGRKGLLDVRVVEDLRSWSYLSFVWWLLSVWLGGVSVRLLSVVNGRRLLLMLLCPYCNLVVLLPSPWVEAVDGAALSFGWDGMLGQYRAM